MTPAWQTDGAALYVGDTRDVLAALRPLVVAAFDGTLPTVAELYAAAALFPGEFPTELPPLDSPLWEIEEPQHDA